jgi:hypothetical protein
MVVMLESYYQPIKTSGSVACIFHVRLPLVIVNFSQYSLDVLLRVKQSYLLHLIFIFTAMS